MTVLLILLGVFVAMLFVILLLFVSLLDVGYRKVEELHGSEAKRSAQREMFNLTSDTFRAMMAEARRRLDQ